jgi:hypothetical protein
MNGETPLKILVDETEQINPAILLAEALMRRDAADLLSAEDINRAEESLQTGRVEIETVERHLKAFGGTPASPSVKIPTGF